MQPVTILPDYVSYFRQLHYGFTLLCDGWAHFFLRRRMTFFQIHSFRPGIYILQSLIVKLVCGASVTLSYSSYCYYDIKPSILLSCADLFGCGTRSLAARPTPALAELGNQGRVCNQPSQCRAPWGQYTLVLDPSASTSHHHDGSVKIPVGAKGWRG